MALPGRDLDPYVSVRRLVIVLLTVFLGISMLIDALSTTYNIDPVVTGTILGAILALSGIDAGKTIGRRP